MIHNHPLLVGLASFCLFVAAMQGPQVDDLKWREVHHEYLGLLLLMIGLALRSMLAQWIGAFLMADDAVQHAVQRFGHKTASRVSLVHWLIEPLYDIRAVVVFDAWLNAHVAKLFSWCRSLFGGQS